MIDKIEIKIVPLRKFLFNVDYGLAVESEMTGASATIEQARLDMKVLNPSAIITFLRELF